MSNIDNEFGHEYSHLDNYISGGIKDEHILSLCEVQKDIVVSKFVGSLEIPVCSKGDFFPFC